MRLGAVAVFAMIAVAAGLCLPAGIAGAEPNHALGPATGILRTDGTRDLPCGYGHLAINGDQWYENGYAWDLAGIQEPDWGSFAECFVAPPDLEVCGLVFDLTTISHNYGRTLDGYLWEDAEGIPGNVLAMVTGFDPWPVATWPEVSRHTVELVRTVTGSFWVGYWPDWPNSGPPEWYIAVDAEGSAMGCPYTKIVPGIGYPTGWHHCDVVWGEGATHALGLGYWGHALPTSSAPEPEVRGEAASWGKVKALYR